MSDLRKIPLDEASADELTEYCRLLGGEVPEKADIPELLAIIKAIRPGEAPIQLPERQVFHQPASPSGKIPPTSLCSVTEMVDGEEVEAVYVGLRLPEQDKPGGKQAVPVSVNGVRMDIPRNMDVWVPLRFYLALDNSRSWEYIPSNTGLKEPRETHDYPFQWATPEHSPHEQREIAKRRMSTVAA